MKNDPSGAVDLDHLSIANWLLADYPRSEPNDFLFHLGAPT